MKTKTLKSISQRGFSLVELLVVIAVIAIIAAIAIPNIANITSQATIAKDQRNAQSIASVAAATIAARYKPTWATKAAVYTDLADGVSVQNGNSTMDFGISPMSTAEQSGAETYLDLATSSAGVVYVTYSPTNSVSTSSN